MARVRSCPGEVSVRSAGTGLDFVQAKALEIVRRQQVDGLAVLQSVQKFERCTPRRSEFMSDRAQPPAQRGTTVQGSKRH
jgi:hypothetical protein